MVDQTQEDFDNLLDYYAFEHEIKTKEDVHEYFEKLYKFSDLINEENEDFVCRPLSDDYLRDTKAYEMVEILKPYLNGDNKQISHIAQIVLREKFNSVETSEDRLLLLPYIDKKDKEAFMDAFKKAETAEELEFLLPIIDKNDPSIKDAALVPFIKAQNSEQTELLLPFVDKEDPKWRLAAFSVFLRSNDTKQVDMLMPMLDIKQETKGLSGDETEKTKKVFDKDIEEELDRLGGSYTSLREDNPQYLLTEVSGTAALEKLIELGAEVNESNILPMIKRGLFHDAVEKKIDTSDKDGNVMLETPYGNIKVAAQDAKEAYIDHYVMTFGGCPEKMSIEDVYKTVKCIDLGEPDFAIHMICHCFERGFMRRKDNRVKGNIVLDKVASMFENGRETINNRRCFEGYWRTAKIYSEAKEDFKMVLEKYAHIPICREFLGYVNGEKEQSLAEKRQTYQKNPDMMYVDTIMVDIDGTLLKADGQLNFSLVKELNGKDYDIYTGGEPDKQRKILLNACEDCKRGLQPDSDVYNMVEKFQTQLSEGKPIYSKNAFTQENICLAKGVYDDTIPEHQGIKSLISYGETERKELENIPNERKITAKQVFELYQQKEQMTLAITNKLKELKDKTKSENIENIPHAKTQILREVAKDNLGKPKRSDADKKVIKAAMDKAINNTRK